MGGFGHAGGGGKGEMSIEHYPAAANLSIKTKTEQGAIDAFAKKYKNADHEYAYVVDSNGGAYINNEGKKHSVNLNGNWKNIKNGTVIHNHPGGGNFSDTDLRTWSSHPQIKSIVAVGKNYTYRVTKTSSFKSKGSGFEKAMSKAKFDS